MSEPEDAPVITKCAQCQRPVSDGGAHVGTWGYECAPAPATSGEYNAALEVEAPCGESEVEEHLFREFWDANDRAILEAAKKSIWQVRGVARAAWAASLRARR